MLTREATYEDYGFSEDEDKRLGEFCKNLEMRDKILLCSAQRRCIRTLLTNYTAVS